MARKALSNYNNKLCRSVVRYTKRTEDIICNAGTHVSTTDLEADTENLLKSIDEVINFDAETGHGDIESFVRDLQFVSKTSYVQTVIEVVSPGNYWKDCLRYLRFSRKAQDSV